MDRKGVVEAKKEGLGITMAESKTSQLVVLRGPQELTLSYMDW